MNRCRFRSSYGGDIHCQDPAYQYGFCRFHFERYLSGEILANGQINEKLTNQVRRREINFHGAPQAQGVYSEPTGDRESRKP